MFFFNCPPAIADFPDLVRGFIQGLAVAWNGDKNRQKENKKKHELNIKKIDSELSTERRIKIGFFVMGSLKVGFPFIIFNSLSLSHSIQVCGLVEGVVEIFTPILRITKSIIFEVHTMGRPLG
jgi:hypothetical protein